jgi:hypothetical protein
MQSNVLNLHLKPKNMNDILFELYGFKFKPNTLYQVTEKLDSSAPSGFVEHKTTKVLHPDVSNSVPGAIFDSELKIWDTGLYDNSKALRKAVPSLDERSKLVKEVIKYIVKPLQLLKGKEYLSQFEDNNTFWDDFRINIFKDKVFNTERPDELLQLYLTVLHRQITPKELESHPDFKNSQYCIVDKEDSIDRKQEKEMGVMEAQSTFFTLLKSKREDLFLILDYLRLSVTPKTDDKVLASLFNNWLKDKTDGFQNYAVFLKTHKFFGTVDGEKELYYHSKIKDLIKKNVIKQKKSEIWFEDEFIGSDLKSATKNIIAQKDLEERFLKQIE